MDRIIALIVLCLLFCGCMVTVTPCPTCEPWPTDTPTPTGTPTLIPDPTPIRTATATNTLAPTPTVTATAVPPINGKKPLVAGFYTFHNHAHVADPMMTGSQLTLTWKQIEPDKRKYDWRRIDDWLMVERSRNHKWILRIDVHQNSGVISWPGWAPTVQLQMADGSGVLAPDYASPVWQSNMIDMILDVGDRYDSDPDLVMVQIGLGLFGETHPERDWPNGNLMGQIYQAGLTGCEWIEYQKQIINAYVYAFPTTELVIMNAPSYPFGCVSHELPGYPTVYSAPVINQYALDAGVGAQNNSWDEWDNRWYTAEVAGGSSNYTVYGAVGQFQFADRFLAMERGSWLSPYETFFKPDYYQTWWSLLNAMDKGASILFLPNLPRRVWNGEEYQEFVGVFGYPDDAPYADDLDEMLRITQAVLDGDAYIWAAFATPPDTPWRQTSQTWDHSAGIWRLDPMEAAWNTANAQPPWYESKYMRRLIGPVRFAVDHPGRYKVTIHYRGIVDVFGKHLSAVDWTRTTFEVDVPAEFTVAGDGWLHAIILEANNGK